MEYGQKAMKQDCGQFPLRNVSTSYAVVGYVLSGFNDLEVRGRRENYFVNCKMLEH